MNAIVQALLVGACMFNMLGTTDSTTVETTETKAYYEVYSMESDESQRIIEKYGYKTWYVLKSIVYDIGLERDAEVISYGVGHRDTLYGEYAWVKIMRDDYPGFDPYTTTWVVELDDIPEYYSRMIR